MGISKEILKDRLETYNVVTGIIAEVSKKKYSCHSGLEEIRRFLRDITFDPPVIEELIKMKKEE